MTDNVHRLFDEAQDIEDRLTLAERRKLEMRFVMRRWDAEIERIRDLSTPDRTNKRNATRFKCPYDEEEAYDLRHHGQCLIELAETIESRIKDRA
jgi:hypothetical protein